MRAVIQRVRRATVQAGGRIVADLERGLLVYLGVARQDTDDDAAYLASKTVNLRIFPDDAGKMNRSLLDLRENPARTEQAPGVLVVSQFTLYGDVRKGRRPSYNNAAPPESATALYQAFLDNLVSLGVPPQAGVFQEHMDVSYTNDGPVTILMDSEKTL